MQIGNVTTQNNVFLAPMAGITDLPFRVIAKEMGAGLTYSEMVSCKGLYYDSQKTADLLVNSPIETPFAVQIFGSDPDIMAQAAKSIDADIIDINMGCPAPKIVRNNEGSALMKQPQLVYDIVSAVVAESAKPVTVKIRRGFTKETANALDIARLIEQAGASAICIHGRTTSEQYSGEADWTITKELKRKLNIPVIGNGDVNTPAIAKKRMDETGCDALMIGRATFGNPFLIREIIHYLAYGEIPERPTRKEICDLALRHSEMVIALKGTRVGVSEMRKHIGYYTKRLQGGSALRGRINMAKSFAEIKAILQEIMI